MLRRIRVQGYKSLRDVEINLQPLSILFGPNAAGKSNFLDILQLLSRMVTSRTLKEAFAPPYRGQPLESYSFGSDGMRGLLKRDSARFSVEVDIELSSATVGAVEKQVLEMKRSPDDPAPKNGGASAGPIRERYLRYKVVVEILPKSGVLRIAEEYLAALNAEGQVSRKRKPFLETMQNRIHVRMEGQSHPTYYDIGLDHCILSRPHYAPHYPHMVAVQLELESWRFFYFEPRERMRTASPVKEVRHIGLMGEELPSFLNTLKVLDEAQFRSLEKSLHAIIPSVTGLDVDVNDLGEVELRIREGELSVPARVVSEGTLRVLGLLALGGAKEPPSLVGFEEPENGIHPRRIQLIAEMLKNRTRAGDSQIIVTTHSLIFPDLVSPACLFVCRKRDATTTIQAFESMGELLKEAEVDLAMNEDDEKVTSVSDRILRGDFDA
ncbi:MAG: AAA family ATPase [Candidatus Hydrogenedentes bacterium]|nr:AAA family ATPase [Candidatus Hydrogenedentota bacterium]